MTRTIRIAVAMDDNGGWTASGWGYPGQTTPDEIMAKVVATRMDRTATVTFIEVEVHGPETIQGRVVDGPAREP